jgi:exodeoxyribonuclease VII small subunit
MPAKKAAKSKPSFTEARARLDELLDELEREAGDVDQLAARIKEASELIRLCRERLSAARQEVREVVAELAAQPDEEAPGASENSEPLPEPPPEAYEDDAPAGGTLPF